MQAIFKTGGHQFTVSPGDEVLVELLDKNQGDVVRFEEVLLVMGEKGNRIGAPTVKGAAVVGTVLGEEKSDRTRAVFFRRRKDSRTTRGHRQRYNRVKIDLIEGA